MQEQRYVSHVGKKQARSASLCESSMHATPHLETWICGKRNIFPWRRANDQAMIVNLLFVLTIASLSVSQHLVLSSITIVPLRSARATHACAHVCTTCWRKALRAVQLHTRRHFTGLHDCISARSVPRGLGPSGSGLVQKRLQYGHGASIEAALYSS